ncbi:patatin-like phospholipase family protein [Nocardioides sp. CFH 31398]|uniref:patatin-like phospholipase family protein n=1 Tax=Nocardioides sp. CFH 31398 TaxID=2919579 RepID=UPI001F06C0CA|nr:patatin-like phospholipase family protein [Nocardioides sp. CFH 31398]MCH1865679.1 patatin-like phospholipase family protein [Nocardioides sp. CFH 31398]
MSAPTTAFVLGGGGVLGAVEVGMLGALLDAGVVPDLVLGTSVGALNGALLAQDPDPAVVARLTGLWREAATTRDVYGDGPLATVRRAVATGTHLYSADPLTRRLREELGDVRLEDLPVRLEVCASSIERAAEHWFTTGPVVDAVIASAAVPGLLPPARVDGEHYLDGGITNSIPLGRAVAQGATRVFVLQVGRIDRPLSVPRRPWEVARVSFEIARRHRFHRELEEARASERAVEVHVLPAAGTSERDDRLLSHRDFSDVEDRITATRAAAAAYLDDAGVRP